MSPCRAARLPQPRRQAVMRCRALVDRSSALAVSRSPRRGPVPEGACPDRRAHRQPPCRPDGLVIVATVARRPRPRSPLRGGTPCAVRSEERSSRPADGARRGRASGRASSAAGRSPALLPPPELPPSGPPVVLGVGVVLVLVSPTAQGVSARFSDEFRRAQDVHSLSSESWSSSPCCPQVCAQDGW